MAKGDELVKYITERVVDYVETPREVRREVRKERSKAKPSWSSQWFGMIPFSISLWFQRFPHKRKSDKKSAKHF